MAGDKNSMKMPPAVGYAVVAVVVLGVIASAIASGFSIHASHETRQAVLDLTAAFETANNTQTAVNLDIQYKLDTLLSILTVLVAASPARQSASTCPDGTVAYTPSGAATVCLAPAWDHITGTDLTDSFYLKQLIDRSGTPTISTFDLMKWFVELWLKQSIEDDYCDTWVPYYITAAIDPWVSGEFPGQTEYNCTSYDWRRRAPASSLQLSENAEQDALNANGEEVATVAAGQKNSRRKQQHRV